MFRRKTRFVGAGASAERTFNRERWENVKELWWVWLLTVLAVLGLFICSGYVSDGGARLLAGVGGLFLGVLVTLWCLGGHVSIFRWWLGAEGERETGKVIEQLGSEWHCEHDLVHEARNWDHVLVGPAGVFLLDSKFLHGKVSVDHDALCSGRMAFPGGVFRGSALRVKSLIEQRLGSPAPFVQGVAVVWGDFPQKRHEEHRVVYVSGDELRAWLEKLPRKLNAPRRAALITALQEVRSSLG